MHARLPYERGETVCGAEETRKVINSTLFLDSISKFGRVEDRRCMLIAAPSRGGRGISGGNLHDDGMNITFNPACPCINVTDLLLSTALAVPVGIQPNVLPHSYGSLSCRAWDSDLYDVCLRNASAHEWCSAEWCYVDGAKCKLSSQYYRASLTFPTLGRDLFFSYDTCRRSTLPSASNLFANYLLGSNQQGREVLVGLPFSVAPKHFKRYPNGSIYSGVGAIYLNDSIPWEGIFVQCVLVLILNTTKRACHTRLRSLCTSPQVRESASRADTVGARPLHFNLQRRASVRAERRIFLDSRSA